MATINIEENSTSLISSMITKEVSSNLDTCKIVVPFNYEVNIGDEINLFDKNSTLLFKGLCQTIKFGNSKEILAYDYGVQLMDVNVNFIYIDYKAEDIIEDIVANKTDLTYVSTIITTTTIPPFRVKDKRGWDVINELCELLGATFRVDKNKNFYLEIIEEDTSSEIITTTNAVIDGEWDEEASQLVNKIILIGDKQLFEKTETFNGNGSTATFTLTEFPVDINVSVGGVEKVGYVQGATAVADYKIDKGTKNVTFETGSIPSSGTNNVVIRYTFSIDIKLVSQDNASITLYGGPNKIPKEKKITKPYINSFAEARKFANFYLGIYAYPLRTSAWFINDYSKFENFVPNQIISVTDSIRNISGNFIIKKVEREFPGQLKVEIGWKEADILDWSKEVQFRIKQLEETDDNSTILQEYDFIGNNVQINVETEVERQLYRTLPDDYMYLADEIPNMIAWWTGDNTIIDRCLNSNDLTWVKVPLQESTPSYTTGHIWDNAFNFNGTNYLKNETIFSPPTTTNTTIAFWVNLDTIITDNTWEGQEIILGIRKNPSTYMYFGLRNSKFIFRTAGGGLSDLSIQSNQKLGDSHIILEWNTNNTFSMWVDGVLIDTQSQVWANSDGYDSEIWIGRFPSDYVGSPYSQVIEDIRYIEGILTNDEKLSLYNYGKGQRGNANFLPISNGVERPFGKQFENTLAWWKLDGTALDEISGTSMTINGTATYTTGKQYDNAISFDGVTQSAYKAMTIPTSSCSISMWVKFNSNSGEDYFMRSDCDDMTYLTFNGSIIRFAKGTTYTRIADSPTITTGVWYNVIVMWESGTAYFYFNNVEYNDGSSSFPAGSDGTYVSLASFNTSAGNQGSDCEFTDVRIFPYLLSEEQRSAIYNDNIGSTDNSETYPKYLITDKDYWGEPDYEIEKTGSLQSWNTF